MNAEMEALEKNKTWELVNLLVGKWLVGCKWVYTIKYRVNETLERYKTRLVAKGYIQTYDVDNLETFASIVKMNKVRILLLLTTYYNWDLQQFDVKNAFLNRDPEEDIYMKIHYGFGSDLATKKVCKLKKAL